MGKPRHRPPRRRRIGRVSIYPHRRQWWVYYREHGQVVRKAAADDEQLAEQVAAQINLELTASAPTLFSFHPLPLADLQRAFLDYHEFVARSSLATVNRYRTATQYLVDFYAARGRSVPAHEIDVEAFVRHLRQVRVTPNGHDGSRRRPLRDNGIRFILGTCRSLYTYAAKRRHLPPYRENPFTGLGGKRSRVEDAKPIFVFSDATELAFLKQADEWSFGVHFLLATLGLRPGELVRLLIEDIDLTGGWLHVRSRPELGAHTKTRRERVLPLIAEHHLVLRRLMCKRASGPVILRQRAELRHLPLAETNAQELAAAVYRRVGDAETSGHVLDRRGLARVHRGVWRDAGATRLERIRTSFIRIAADCGLSGATCPKSWRHTFATLLQDANVDPLVRQLTLGHAPPSTFGASALGMTSVYTHTRPETLRREIERALRLWPATLELARSRCSSGSTLAAQ